MRGQGIPRLRLKKGCVGLHLEVRMSAMFLPFIYMDYMDGWIEKG